MFRKEIIFITVLLSLVYFVSLEAKASISNNVSIGIPPHGIPRPDGTPKLQLPIVIIKGGSAIYVVSRITLYNCKIELIKNGILTKTLKYDCIAPGECLKFDSNETDELCIYINDRLIVDREL